MEHSRARVVVAEGKAMPQKPLLLLDVMGTIVYDPFFREVPDFLGLSMEQLWQVKHPTSWVDFEKGKMGEEEYLADFFRDGRVYDQEGLKTCMQEAYRYLDGMEALLADLHAQGAQMYAFSNYPQWYRWIEDKLKLSRFLQWRFVSCETGTRKPDHEAYLHVLQALGVAGHECLFIDDREANCEAAREVGLGALCFRDAPTLRAACAQRGLL